MIPFPASMRFPVSRRRSRQGGNTFVEFALSAGLLAMVMMGTFRFGYTFYQYNNLVTAVRSGARFASMRDLANPGNGVVPDNYASAVKKLVVYGNPAGGTKPIVPGLTEANVEIQMSFDTKFVPRTVTVGLKDFQIDALFTKFKFNGKPKLTLPYSGKYCVGCV